MITVNMFSKADSVEGQGVLSAYREQVNLVKTDLASKYTVYENSKKFCDVNHYHTVNPSFLLNLPRTKKHGVTLASVHFLPETLDTSLDLPLFCKKIFYAYIMKFYKSMDYLVTVNPYFIDKLAEYNIDRNKIKYIPNFVCHKKFFPVTPLSKISLRKKYKIDADKFVVLCAGQLQKRKGFFELIDLAKDMPDIQFLWAGNFAFGAISDGYKEIKKISKNPPPNVKLLGLIERDRMNELYNIANLMFLPSFEELFPMTILEAMSCKTPILLRDLDIYPNILFDFYQKGSSNQDFKQLIYKLRDDNDFYKHSCELSHKGHKFYSREHVASMWDDLYSQIYHEYFLKNDNR